MNELPVKIESIDLSWRDLTILPDLSRFTNLKLLDCSNNQLTSLPPLNNSLVYLDCSWNKLTSLPPLNNSLEYLNCSRNQLNSLPPLNDFF